ncbi:MAG: glycosyltransferase [bacterium]
MHKDIIKDVIFAPGTLAIDLVKGLADKGHEVVFFSPDYPIDNKNVANINANLSFFEEELKLRGYGYIELLNKHPLTFITLARQVQSELVSKAYKMAEDNKLDILHFFTNEEEIALAFAKLSTKPVVFTHHEPFNFLTKYRSQFELYKDLNWISISNSQQKTSTKEMNYVGNVYNGIPQNMYEPNLKNDQKYFTYIGRIIEAKGVHLAIQACIKAGVELRIAGKHYENLGKDKYWEEKIKPYIDAKRIKYMGYLNTKKTKQELLSNSIALIMPSIWEEPFGMVAIESLACGTPVIGLNSGAIPEIVRQNINGVLVEKDANEENIVNGIVKAIKNVENIDRKECRKIFEENFTLQHMVKGYEDIYIGLVK